MTSQPDQSEEIRREAARVHESALYSAENQFANCRVWRLFDRTMGTTAAVLAAVAGVTGLANVSTIRVVGLVAVLSAAFGAIIASVGPAKVAERASTAANSYRNLQQDVRIFMKVDLANMPHDEAREHLQTLVERQQELNKAAPVPSALARRMARKSISQGGQDYEVDQS